MSDLTYIPSEPLGEVATGDAIEVIDRNGTVIGESVIEHVGKRHVRTACGRRWTLTDGEFISEFNGGKARCYPFPWIRKKAEEK
jgi:hypothetical protein